MSSSATGGPRPDLLQTVLAQQVDLNQVTPEEGLKEYLNHREDEQAASTLDVHKSRLSYFIDWCQENDIQYLSDLDGGDLQAFRNWRKDGLSVSSLASNLHTLRVFLQIGVVNESVRPDLPSKVDIPSVDESEESRDVMVSAETASEMLSYLEQFHYATTQHVCWLILASTGMRTSAVRALDLQDVTRIDDGAILELVHRPDSETGLKNKARSERPVYIGTGVAEIIEDYVAEHRPDVIETAYDEREDAEKLALRREIRETAYADSHKDEYYK